MELDIGCSLDALIGGEDEYWANFEDTEEAEFRPGVTPFDYMPL